MYFYVLGAVLGLVLGATQSLARSTYSKLLPETEDHATYFSFYDVAEKIGIVIGMVIFATIDQITGSMRNSIIVFLFIFLIGAFLLKRIKIKNV